MSLGFIRSSSVVHEIFVGSSWVMLLLLGLWLKKFFLVSRVFWGYNKQHLSHNDFFVKI